MQKALDTTEKEILRDSLVKEKSMQGNELLDILAEERIYNALEKALFDYRDI